MARHPLCRMRHLHTTCIERPAHGQRPREDTEVVQMLAITSADRQLPTLHTNNEARLACGIHVPWAGGLTLIKSATSHEPKFTHDAVGHDSRLSHNGKNAHCRWSGVLTYKMTKRKASTSVPTSDKTTTTGASTEQAAMEKAALAAERKEYREYLLANAGATIEDTMIPPAKKRKTTSKKVAAMKQEVADVDESAAKPEESRGPGTPRNVAASKEPKAATRKASITLPTPDVSDSPESRKSNESKLESDLTDVSPPQAKKSKAAAKKRKTEAPLKGEDDVEGGVAAVDGTPPKKRIRTASKRGSPASSETTPPAVSPLLPPRTAQLSAALSAKVRSVHAFMAEVSETDSLLTRDPANPSLISIPELELIGALIRLRADYELGDPYEAHIADIETCIVNRYSAPVLQTPDQAWITLDVSTEPSDFEREIFEKVAGHGLEDVNLLEIELEMHSRRMLARLGGQQARISESVPSAPEEMRGHWERTWSNMLEAETLRATEAEKQRASEAEKQLALEPAEKVEASATPRVAIRVDSGGLDEKHMGVCPVPAVEMV
ncbi:hypothetical protein LTS16_001796 [Friedmanniomyces endolithicus]|uniref:Uncharacterized protein n=1 Tax=Friedmanniomyces endolithicus TaxID=329885 RepID=A0AAN6G0R6_9PEZI|nr:hypothetical protein LTR82_001472 [Friedmanniomyces endolithicus]KAK0923715.1 hypothetical protein LTR57_006649 [Friedmanniomyces endolithicus]KAK1052727.1 hypothetical protein LTS16_001796 [Friedmanniomyces endolithicus]